MLAQQQGSPDTYMVRCCMCWLLTGQVSAVLGDWDGLEDALPQDMFLARVRHKLVWVAAVNIIAVVRCALLVCLTCTGAHHTSGVTHMRILTCVSRCASAKIVTAWQHARAQHPMRVPLAAGGLKQVGPVPHDNSSPQAACAGRVAMQQLLTNTIKVQRTFQAARARSSRGASSGSRATCSTQNSL